MSAERYLRQTMLAEIGEAGQRRLRDARVLVVGLGGLGAVVTTYLAGAGIGTLVLADHDTVSLSNLQRQVLYSEADVGKPKAECAARRVAALNSDVAFEICRDGLTTDNAGKLVGSCDLVVDCTDNYPARFLIDDTCAALHRPWVYGSIGEFAGQVSVFQHRQGRRYAELYAERDALCSLPRTQRGVLGAVPGVVGAVEACQAVKLLAGFGELLEGRLWTIDLLTLETMTFEF